MRIPGLLLILMIVSSVAGSDESAIRQLRDYCAISGYLMGTNQPEMANRAVMVAAYYGSPLEGICSDATAAGYKAGQRFNLSGKTDKSDIELMAKASAFSTRVNEAILRAAGFPYSNIIK